MEDLTVVELFILGEITPADLAGAMMELRFLAALATGSAISAITSDIFIPAWPGTLQ